MPFKKRAIRRLQSFVYRVRHNQLIKALAAIFLVALFAAIGVTLFEGHVSKQFSSIGRGLWWALVTMTTVGYGDMVPATTPGKIIAAVVMFSGIALVSVFTAAVSSLVITRRLNEGKGLSQIRERNHIAILGWNTSGEEIIQSIQADAIRENRTIVLVNKLNQDAAEKIIHNFDDLEIKFVYGDYTDESILSRANIKQAYAAIILPDDSDPSRPKSDEPTILATLSVKSIEPKVRVIAHILEPENEMHLRRAKADQIVVSNRYSGFLLASHVVAPGIPEALDQLLSAQHGVRFGRRKIPHSMNGKTFAEVSSFFKTENDSILIGFIKQEKGFNLDDVLSGDYSAIDDFIRKKLEEAGKGIGKKPKIEIILNPTLDYVVSDKDLAVVIERIEL